MAQRAGRTPAGVWGEGAGGTLARVGTGARCSSSQATEGLADDWRRGQIFCRAESAFCPRSLAEERLKTRARASGETGGERDRERERESKRERERY